MSDIALFEPEDLPEGLAGVDAAFLADLYDLVLKYGTDVERVPELRRLAIGSPKTIYLFAAVPPSRQRNMFLSRWPVGASMSTSHFFMIKDGVASFVLWDRSFSVAEVRSAAAELDAAMDAARDPLSGARRRMPTDAKASAVFLVDTVFAKRGRTVAPGDGTTIEALRAQFDRPEDVAIVTKKDGRQFLCHVRDAHGYEPAVQEAAIRRVIARHGLRDESELRALPRSELEKMFEEINAELFGGKN